MRYAWIALVLVACGGSPVTSDAAMAGDAGPPSDANCGASQALCEGECVVLLLDRHNCGECGNDCGDLICGNGVCE